MGVHCLQRVTAVSADARGARLTPAKVTIIGCDGSEFFSVPHTYKLFELFVCVGLRFMLETKQEIDDLWCNVL